MKWRGRRSSDNVEDRRGLSKRSWYDPRRYTGRVVTKFTPLSKKLAAAVNQFISGKGKS